MIWTDALKQDLFEQGLIVVAFEDYKALVLVRIAAERYADTSKKEDYYALAQALAAVVKK